MPSHRVRSLGCFTKEAGITVPRRPLWQQQAWQRRAWRRLKQLSCSAALPLALALALCAGGPTHARADVVIVGNDYGGVLIPRLANLQAIKLRGATVEIRGDICASACTLYLGLETTCILPKTRFGFHGPSQHGKPLPQADYERLSQVVAAQYPLVLRDWFMTSGRETLVRMQFITGQTLIGLGLRQCGPPANS
jgi:hypothetical protein